MKICARCRCIACSKACWQARLPQLQQHHILLERNWADPLPRVVGIGGHLKQVFYDLVANAIRGDA
ncbi:MAG: hypothetical protein U0Z44_15895 [Kouleothrix sp.]